ncbi:unnamed protein product [Penicillium egyptiacum]|uniref:Uncharacterized protein n=1 Tax=Penicillium egyptiacum TaxID=1303716 RepID=A0A9W4KJG4_9EURO|nr:unnamed protein product [Penicillium egyptiacum]
MRIRLYGAKHLNTYLSHNFMNYHFYNSMNGPKPTYYSFTTIDIMFRKGVLPSTTPKYEFKGIRDCLQSVEQALEKCEENPYVIFVLDEPSFLDCFLKSGESLLTKSWEAYDPSINHLLIKMESQFHGVALRAFERVFDAWDMDSHCPLVTTGRTICRGSSGKKKEPASTWIPRHSGRKWPTVVLEVTYNETPKKMEENAKFWLTESSEVATVLTVEVFKRGRISVKQWNMRGATAVPSQAMEIVRNPAPNCKKIQGSIRLALKDIYLRPKRQHETDFVLTPHAMEQIASPIWHTQFGD